VDGVMGSVGLYLKHDLVGLIGEIQYNRIPLIFKLFFNCFLDTHDSFGRDWCYVVNLL